MSPPPDPALQPNYNRGFQPNLTASPPSAAPPPTTQPSGQNWSDSATAAQAERDRTEQTAAAHKAAQKHAAQMKKQHEQQVKRAQDAEKKQADEKKKEAEKAASKQKSDTAKAAKEKQQNILDHLNNLIGPGLGYSQVSGAGANALGGQISKLLAQLPYNVASHWMQSGNVKNLLKNNPALSTAIQSAGQQAAGGGGPSTKPAWDPLALQTMWHDVFGPAMKSANAIAGNVGGGYMAGMNQAIANSNASPQNRAQMTGDAQAMANLLQATGKNAATQASGGQIGFDTLINALQQGGAAATQAQGELEKVFGVQQAAAVAPYYTGQSGSAGAGSITPGAAGGILSGALGGSPASQIGAGQTSSTAQNNPFLPNMPYVP